MDWYYANRGTQFGPITQQDFTSRTRAGEIGPETFVWRPQFDGWKRAKEIPGLFIESIKQTACPPQPLQIEGEGLAKAVIVLLILGGVLDVFSFLITLATAGGGQGAELLNAIVIPEQLVYWTTGGLFAAWAYRCYRNLLSFRIEGLRFTPGWAAGAFFVPFVNLVRPYQIFSEIWKASDDTAGPSDWKHRSVSPLLTGWWIAFIAMCVSGPIAVQATLLQAGPDVLVALSLIGEALSVIAGVLAILVVIRTVQRQRSKAATIPYPGIPGR